MPAQCDELRIGTFFGVGFGRLAFSLLVTFGGSNDGDWALALATKIGVARVESADSNNSAPNNCAVPTRFCPSMTLTL